jgi:hypothetical protein
MDIAKEKQRILDYIAGLQGAQSILELKMFIESLKKSNSQKVYSTENKTIATADEPLTQYNTENGITGEETEYVLTDKGLRILEERQAAYERGEFVTAEEADREIDQWLSEQ